MTGAQKVMMCKIMWDVWLESTIAAIPEMLEPVMVTARAPPDVQLQSVLLFCVKSIYISKLLTVSVPFVPLGPNT